MNRLRSLHRWMTRLLLVLTSLTNVCADDERFGLPNFAELTWEDYPSFLSVEQYILRLPQIYPNTVNVKELGLSYEGRPLYLVTIGKPRLDGESKPAIWIDGLTHAREWISGTVATFMMNELLKNYATDSSITELFDNLDFYFMPVVNPDGYEFSRMDSETRLWRLSRRVNPFSESIGVDLNRNYDFRWMEVGASQDALRGTYAGPSPMSEPEVLALTEAVLERKKHIKAFVTLHSAAQAFLIPWGFTSDPLSDYMELKELGVRAAEAINPYYGMKYVAGSLSDLTNNDPLVLSAGASDDWAKGKAGIKYVYTLELRDNGTYEFLLPPDQIVPSGIETFQALILIAKTVMERFV